MNANELRIGNYVKDRMGSIRRIDYMDEYKIYQRAYVGDTEVHPLTEFYKKLKPVKLTEEWLLRFGFEKVGYNFEKEWLLLHVNKRTGTFDFLLNEPFSEKMHITAFEYVHQLQNLYFALTGEELKETKTSKTSNAEN